MLIDVNSWVALTDFRGRRTVATRAKDASLGHHLLEPILLAKKRSEPADFEAALKELEELVEKMEQGELSLEASLAAFERGPEVIRLGPSQLDGVDTVHAMTIHKSQGSQFDGVTVLLPPPESRILTRELLYTAVTRSQGDVTVVATRPAVESAVRRQVARASALRERLEQ